MPKYAGQDLERLDRLDLWFVILYWRYLLLRQAVRDVPATLKLVAVHSTVFAVMTLGLPPAPAPQILQVLTLWMGAFAMSVAVCSMLPRRHP